MLTYSIIAAASFMSYLLGVFFGDDLEKYWRYALLCPIFVTIFKLVSHSTAFRFESPKWILQKFTEKNQLSSEAIPRKKIRRLFSEIYKPEIVEDVLERECNIYKKTDMAFRPSL